jgi:hypothetical protein
MSDAHSRSQQTRTPTELNILTYFRLAWPVVARIPSRPCAAPVNVSLVRKVRAMTIGRTARLVLLVATVLGLAGMHTLGHGGPHVPAAGAHHVASASMVADPAPDDACAGDGCDLVMWHPGQSHPDMPMWEVCLAVLVGLAVLAMAAALMRVRRTPASGALGHGYTVRPLARGPTALPVGLTLATVSVLRT